MNVPDSGALKPAAAMAVVLAAFFVAGFITSTVMDPGGSSVKAPDNGAETDISREEALNKAREKLLAGPFSYPFTYNVSTASFNTHEVGDGTFYNWTVSYVVEPNPFQSPLYTVPEGMNRTTKSLTVYVSSDGEYLFQSPPITTEVRQQPTGGLPR